MLPPQRLPISVGSTYKRNFQFSALERHDALYVVGALDETLELRGLRYHPIDIETSVSRTHRSIAEWYEAMKCACFP